MKRTIAAFLFAVTSLSPAFADDKPAGSVPADNAPKAMLLPAVRRIAIDLPRTNANEFRNYVSGKNLSGLLALPLTEAEVEQEVMKKVESAVIDTGRFWSLSVDSTIDFLQHDKKQSGASIYSRLQKQYDLDGWLATEMRFQPDHTLLRVSLLNSGRNRTLAREDITLATQPSSNEILTAVQSALVRLISTLGHDGQVTYHQDDVVTIDFGKERGLSVGTKLKAGAVVLSAFHPQTGEFLRAKRIDTHELEVTEVRKGSSLCRVVAVDKVSYNELLQRHGKDGSLPLLAWRDPEKKSEVGWTEPASTELAPIVSGAGSGFGSVNKRPQGYEKTPVTERAESKTPGGNGAITRAKDDSRRPESNSEQSLFPETSQDATEGELLPADAQQSGPRPIWYPRKASAGLGIVEGSLSNLGKDNVTRKTGFSPGLFASAVYLYEGWLIEPSLEFKSYMASDETVVSGLEYNLEVAGATQVYDLGEGKILAGGSLDYAGGTVKTLLLKKEKGNTAGTRDLSDVSLAGIGIYVHKIPDALNLDVTLGVGVPSFGAKFKVRGTNISGLPKELGFFITYRSIPFVDWSEYGLGAHWDVL